YLTIWHPQIIQCRSCERHSDSSSNHQRDCRPDKPHSQLIQMLKQAHPGAMPVLFVILNRGYLIAWFLERTARLSPQAGELQVRHGLLLILRLTAGCPRTEVRFRCVARPRSKPVILPAGGRASCRVMVALSEGGAMLNLDITYV